MHSATESPGRFLRVQTAETVWRFLLVIVALVVAMALSSCGGGGSTGGGGGVSVTITPTTTTMTPSSSATFQATVTGATDERITWTSSGGSITDVGVFTAPATTGTYTVTATSVADPSKSATATVTVAVATGVTVSVSPSTLNMAPNGEAQFTATVTGTSNTGVTWTASAGSISADGTFTAPATPQSVTVTATSKANPSASAFARVNVTNTAPVVTITPLGANLGTNETKQFTASVANVSNHQVTWSATGGTIDSTGLFRAGHTPGTFKVTATSVADPTVSTSVNVTVNQITVTVTPNGANVTAGSTVQFHSLVRGTTNTAVTWSASAGSINSAGLFTAPTTTGPVTITATSVADPTVTGTGTVTIVVSVVVTPNGTTVIAGSQVQFTATVTGTSNTAVTWTTSGGTISASGLLTTPSTAGSGTVTVTATSVANPSFSGSATINLVDASDFVYDFESGVPSGWTPTTSGTTPLGARKFLGRFAGNTSATLSLSGLSTHKSVTVSFDLFVIGGWTGSDANSKFTVTVNGNTAFSRTFSNVDANNQTYPDGGSNAPGTGSAEQNSLGYNHTPAIKYNDTVYHISFTVNDTAAAAALIFAANLAGGIDDQSWGIDNVHVHANP